MSANSFVRGVTKQLVLGTETAFGVKAAANAGRTLRRVNSAPVLNKDQIRSQEILPSMQVRDARHGVRRPAIPFNGQLAPGSYPDFFEGILRRNFTGGTTTGAQTTIAAAAGPPGTFTRSGGSFITDGFKVGDVVRWTGWTTTGAGNNNRNYRITGLTATVMTVTGLGNEAVAAKAAGDSVTCALVGKKTFIPADQASQLFKSYTVEQYFPDAVPALSERYVGCTMQSLRMSIPASGLLTIDAQMTGKDMEQAATPYFTAPAAPGSNNSLAGVSGLLRVAGADTQLVTQAQVSVACPIDANPVVGSNTVPALFPGMLQVDGSMSVYLTDSYFQDLFLQEQECDLSILLTSDTSLNSPFMAITMNRIKTMAVQKNDSDRSIMQALSFQALEHVSGAGAGTAYDQTSIIIQDSSLV